MPSPGLGETSFECRMREMLLFFQTGAARVPESRDRDDHESSFKKNVQLRPRTTRRLEREKEGWRHTPHAKVPSNKKGPDVTFPSFLRLVDKKHVFLFNYDSFPVSHQFCDTVSF